MTQENKTSAPVEKNSFKAMIKAGVIKRTDSGMSIRYADIHVRPGLNLRDTSDPDYVQANSELDAYMETGGHIPALEVVARPEGGVYIVEGHRRHGAFGRRVEAGKDVEWIRIEPFTGNDEEQEDRVLTSQSNFKLKPLEVAEGYRRKAARGRTPEQIAQKLQKTRQHVEQMLILASANSDVHAMVSKGVVSAAIAIEATRKHGEKAGEFLLAQHDKATAAGSTKVTAKTMHGKALPRPVVETVVGAVRQFADDLTADVKKAVVNAWQANSRGEACDEMVQVSAFALAELMQGYQAIADQAQKESEAARRKAEKKSQKEIDGLRPKFPGDTAEQKAAKALEKSQAKAAEKLLKDEKKAADKLQKQADKDAAKAAKALAKAKPAAEVQAAA